MNLIRVAGNIVNMDTVLYVEYGGEHDEACVRFNFSGRVQPVTDNVASDDTKWPVKGRAAARFIARLEGGSRDVTAQER